MSKGTSHQLERGIFTDKESGLKVIQVTSFPTINQKLYFHDSSFTPDSKSFIFLSQTTPSRGAGFDIYKVDVDGTNFIQLTDKFITGGAQMSPDGKKVYFLRENALYSLDLQSLDENLISESKDIIKGGGGTISPDGKYYITSGRTKDERFVLVRFSTDGSEEKIIYEHPFPHPIAHEQYEPSGSGTVLFNSYGGEKQISLWLVNDNGSNYRLLKLPRSTGHFMWVGKSKKILSTTHPEGNIVTISDGDEEPTVVVRGEKGCLYFWHAGVSQDGKWAVSDTNWPDTGLKLINLETGKYKTLCLSESSNGHPQWSHPHPSFSPNKKVVVFNSDRMGIPNVYMVHISDEFYKSV